MDDTVKPTHSRRLVGSPRRRPANRIKALREARGLTLDALAERAGTTNQQICHLEAGRRRLTVDWLCRLGEALGCHPWALVADIAPSTLSSQDEDVLQAFAVLTPAEREAALVLLRALARKRVRPRASKRS